MTALLRQRASFFFKKWNEHFSDYIYSIQQVFFSFSDLFKSIYVRLVLCLFSLFTDLCKMLMRFSLKRVYCNILIIWNTKNYCVVLFDIDKLTAYAYMYTKFSSANRNYKCLDTAFIFKHTLKNINYRFGNNECFL